ncbi:WD repeat-containing protein 82-A [Smittium culicis]|uniref:WD repeat-containing protein 82-A n=1 Tax=Smittium culicis TaxID=133412 RepID=A0A1R1X3K2_9FUNG|nr:WD repeat-containing protein 82-A [Smittium culicis]
MWDISASSPVNSFVLSHFDSTQGTDVDFDPTGTIFAVASGSKISLFDIRNIDKYPLFSFDILQTLENFISSVPNNLSLNKSHLNSPISSVQFSKPFGDSLLISTANGLLYLIDSFRGNLLLVLLPSTDTSSIYSPNPEQLSTFSYYSPQNIQFTPDGSSIVSGTFDGTIHMWNIHEPLKKLGFFDLKASASPQSESGYLYFSSNPALEPIILPISHSWQGHHTSPVYTLGINPKLNMAISSGSDVSSFFIPDHRSPRFASLYDQVKKLKLFY